MFSTFLLLLLLPLLALIPPTTPYRGSITYYNTGLGSCGISSTDADPVAALAIPMMDNPANPNHNPKCGQHIHIFNPETGVTHVATVVDTCYNCAKEDLDLSPSLFDRVAPRGDGRVRGIEWGFVE